MKKLIYAMSVGLVMLVPAQFAASEEAAIGSVIKYSGEEGELIVSRDGIVYWLSVDDELFTGDVLRAQQKDVATVIYNGCVITLPAREDVQLDEQFCELAAVDGITMAEMASDGLITDGATPVANAPLVVGSSLLALGGLADAVDGGDGGTASVTSVAAGVTQASASTPDGN